MPTQCARHLFVRVYWTTLFNNSFPKHRKIIMNFYMWVLNQRSETHKSILHFLLFLVEFSNDTSKLPILPMCHFLFSLVF